MKKFFKTVFLVGGSAVTAHFGIKAYRRIKGIAKLNSTLPGFLSNVYGESPRLSMNHSLNLITLNIGFSQEILDKYDDIENTVREYIDDFYPEIAKCSIDINLHVKGEEEGEATMSNEVSLENENEADKDMDKTEETGKKAKA